MCVCDRCLLVVKFSLLTLDPTLIKLCCEIKIGRSISLTIGVNVHEWVLSPTVPNNKPYVHAYFRYLSKTLLCAELVLTSLSRGIDVLSRILDRYCIRVIAGEPNPPFLGNLTWRAVKGCMPSGVNISCTALKICYGIAVVALITYDRKALNYKSAQLTDLLQIFISYQIKKTL